MCRYTILLLPNSSFIEMWQTIEQQELCCFGELIRKHAEAKQNTGDASWLHHLEKSDSKLRNKTASVLWATHFRLVVSAFANLWTLKRNVLSLAKMQALQKYSYFFIKELIGLSELGTILWHLGCHLFVQHL